MKKLRIAMVGSNFIRLPPTPVEKYVPSGSSAAVESIIYSLTESLVQRGHDVTLFASEDSDTSAQLVSIPGVKAWPHMKRETFSKYEQVLVAGAFRQTREKKFDILHTHSDLKAVHFTPLVETPTVQTLHSPLEGILKDILSYYKKSQYYVSLSNAQRRGLPDLQYVATVPNGIDADTVPFQTQKEDYLVHIGTVYPGKGTFEAIEVARRANERLLIFGSVREETEYWQAKIKPQIDGKQIVYMGLVDRKALFPYVAKAKALVFPLQWEEPFGLVMIEAMACGTPVIALRRGAVPEVVVHEKTGFVVDTLEEMEEALKRVSEIDPAACRQHVEKNFTVEKMVDGYEAVYYKILEPTAPAP